MHMEAERPESIFRSDGYELKFWEYGDAAGQKTVHGYTEHFCITYVYRGNFRYDLFNRQYDLHTGHILIDKPQYEFSLPPAAGVSTVFRFYPDFYRQLLEEDGLKGDFFFANPNLLSLMLTSNPEADYLHYQIMANRAGTPKIAMDSLVMEFLHNVLQIVSDKPVQSNGDSTLKKYHVSAIEKAKEYMHQHFSRDISLKEIATCACTSMFHFSRVFKQFTSCSPHQYLLQVRLKHAALLLKNTSLPIGEIATTSGFKMPEHFATAFRQKFHTQPKVYRNGITTGETELHLVKSPKLSA